MRIIIFTITLFMSSLASSAMFDGEILFSRLEVECLDDSEELCLGVENRFDDFKGEAFTYESFLEKMKIKLLDNPYLFFSYKILKNKDDFKLRINVDNKKTIGNIEVLYNVNVNLPATSTYFPLKIGERFDESKLKRIKPVLVRFLADRGFTGAEFNFVVDETENEVNIKTQVRLSHISRIQSVKIDGLEGEAKAKFERRFNSFKGEVLDRLEFKLAVDQLSRELIESGYINSEVNVLPEETLGDSEVIVGLDIKLGARYGFHFTGNKHLSRLELKNVFLEGARQSSVETIESSYRSAIIKSYKERGIYNTEVKIHKQDGFNKLREEYVHFFVNIEEGQKQTVEVLDFKGNSFFTDDELEELYFRKGTELASRGFLDEKYLENFQNLLTEKYHEKGFVFIEVGGPSIVQLDSGGSSVSFVIRERQQSILRRIEIDSIPINLKTEIVNELVNKEGRPLDVTSLEEDLEKVLSLLQSEGYLFVEIENLNNENLLNYNSNYSEVELSIQLRLSEKVVLNEVLYTGYNKTKLEVLKREIDIEKGDLVTPRKISQIRERLSSLDLFSDVRVTTRLVEERQGPGKLQEQEQFVNLLVQVSEKAFGVGEIAPGFRTDLGAKASVGLTYNNISGMNRSASLNVEANSRLDFSDFDERRRREEKDLLEYSIKFNFTEPFMFPNLLDSQIQFDAGLSFQRKRFVSFDADIFRISPQISKTFFDRLVLSLKYQFERISQFDATNEDFNDDFIIGSITPSMSLDLRDDSVRPTKGAYFGLNWEFANPFLLSMDDEDITINYYRLTSRNNFYIPVTNFFTLAFSVAGGFQKNFADEIQRDVTGKPLRDSNGNILRKGFIPSTKVFRLDGFDIVRGFDAQEINKLITGENIGEVVVSDTAYFVNFKMEPRYYVNDLMALGVFFDAGRVFVDSFRPLDLRTSAGLTLKLLTPVGSLDFDYGVKLKRERYDNGDRESFGRFHLSIGFF